MPSGLPREAIASRVHHRQQLCELEVLVQVARVLSNAEIAAYESALMAERPQPGRKP
ncbi:hypothetical protein AB0J52_12545 [Spirillospora sp. NPDC049652]